MAKFGHVVANDSNHPLMKKFRLKKVPAVLIGSRGDPEDLNQFEGRMDADAIEKALAIAARNKLSKAAKDAKKKTDQPMGKDLVSHASDQEKLQACLSHHGICMLFLFRAQKHQKLMPGRPPVVSNVPPQVSLTLSLSL